MIKIICDPSTDDDDIDIGICRAGFCPDSPAEDEPPYIYGNSLEHDASTRDYTFNAIYVDVVNGVVFDPVGGLSEDTVVVESGKCFHTLRSCAVALGKNVLLQRDIGGQFRFFKELMKSCDRFNVAPDRDTKTLIDKCVAMPSTTSTWIRCFVKKLFAGVNDESGVDEALLKIYRIAPCLLQKLRKPRA